MFERTLFKTLTEGLQQLVQRPRALEAFLDQLPLDEALGEPAKARTVILDFAAQERPVIHGFARAETVFPVWSIVLAGESETMRALGDESDDDDGFMGEAVITSVWKSTYQIFVYSKLPDTTLYLYQLAKALLNARRHELIRAGGNVLDVGGFTGQDLFPDTEKLPAWLFVRTLSLTATVEEKGLSLLGPPKGVAQDLPVRQVVGVHVHDPRVVDGIRHLVTPEE